MIRMIFEYDFIVGIMSSMEFLSNYTSYELLTFSWYSFRVDSYFFEKKKKKQGKTNKLYDYKPKIISQCIDQQFLPWQWVKT